MKTTKSRLLALENTFLAACIAVALANLNLGCTKSVDSGAKTPPSAAVTGSLAVSVPAIAAWLQAYRDEVAGTPIALVKPRALAVTTSIKIEVLDSSGNPVIIPSILRVYEYNPGSSATQNLSLIPVGTGYTVKVSVYNNHMSSTTPVVSGQTAGVDIVEGATTAVSVTCLPVSPTTITIDGSVNTATLTYNSEKWYSFPVTNGTNYYLTQSSSHIVMGIFNGSGTFVSSNSSYIHYLATYTGTLYLVAVADSTGGIASITVTTAAPILNEGSLASPIALTLNTAHAFKSGPSGDQDVSYYCFTTTAAGNYALDTSYGYYILSLYSDAGFSSVLSSAYTNYGSVFAALSPGTTYYLTIQNGLFSSSMAISGQIADPAVIATYTAGEGSVISPVSINLDSSWSGKVGAKTYSNSSCYTFTTGIGSDYSISLSSIAPVPNHYLFLYLYDDPAFATYVATLNIISSGSALTDIILSPSATYYIKVAHSVGDGDTTYNLLVSIYTPTFISLPSSGTWTLGNLSPAGTVRWYQATVTGGQSYILNWDSYSEGSGTYTLSPYMSAYQADRLTSYFTDENLGYNTQNTQVISVPAGQTTIYVKVAGSYFSSTGTFALKLAPKPATGSLSVTIN